MNKTTTKIINKVGTKKCKGCMYRIGGLHLRCSNPNKCVGSCKKSVKTPTEECI